jgi:hypothetical protein
LLAHALDRGACHRLEYVWQARLRAKGASARACELSMGRQAARCDNIYRARRAAGCDRLGTRPHQWHVLKI